MRKLFPTLLVTSIALALGSGSALAASGAGTTRPAASATTATATTGTTTTSSSTTAPAASSGSCVGTGGSTCSATTTANTTSNTALGTTAPSETNAGVNVTAPVATSTAPSSTSPSSGGTSVATSTLAGPEVFNPTPGVATTASGVGAGMIVPGVVTTMDAGVNANGERIVAAPSVAADAAPTPTPLFDLTARQGLAKEALRRARGEEPRVYGIAPRTERDLTHQMPDDPIIRY